MGKKVRKITYLPEHHTSIDTLPVMAWEAIHSSMDMSYLLLKRKKLTKAQKIKLNDVWRALYDEYIRVFGFEDNFQAIVSKNLEISRLKLKKLIKNDESIQNFINRKIKDLEALKRQNTGGKDIYKAKQAIEKKMGFYIPLNTITVREFYSYLKNKK